jgi:hypothetical protein
VRDLYKFVKDFPIDIIPHMTEDELVARSKEREGKLKNPENLMLDKNQLKQSTISTKDNENVRSPMMNRHDSLHFDKQFLTCHHV